MTGQALELVTNLCSLNHSWGVVGGRAPSAKLASSKASLRAAPWLHPLLPKLAGYPCFSQGGISGSFEGEKTDFPGVRLCCVVSEMAGSWITLCR